MLAACFITYLLGLVILALLLRRHIGHVEGFFLAGRKLSRRWIAVATVAAWFGAGSTMATMNQAYQTGLGAIWLIAVPSIITVAFVSVFLAKPIRQLPYLSQPHAIQARYGPAARAILSVIILVSLTAFMASQLVAAIALLHSAGGLPQEGAVGAILTAVVAYSCLGGFRMVVLTDIFHFTLCTLALAILLAFVLFHPGVSGVLAHLPAMTWNITTHWPQNLLLMLTFILAWSIAPEMWQRMAATQTPQTARQAAWMAGIFLAVLYAMVIATGILAHGAIAHANPSSPTPILITLALQLPPWLQAVALVGILSALTSTIDSSLNVASLTLTHDILHRYFLPNTPEAQRVWTARFATLLMAFPAALIAMYKPDIIDMLWLSATLYACTMFIPIMGLFYAPKAPPQAGVWAMLLGAVPCAVTLLTFFTGNRLAGFWAQSASTILWGVGFSLLGFVLASWRYAKKSNGIVMPLEK